MASYKTNQQSCLLKFLKAHPREPMSVHEMYRRMGQEHPVQSIPGESTIYRLLRKFTEEGLVRKSVDTQSREASFETVAFLSQKVDELGVSTVFTIENSDQKIAKTIIENTKDKNQKILALNSLQSVSNEQIQNGMTYLGLMQENYDTLKEALN